MPSLADIAAVTRNGNGNGDGFGGNNGWWVLIILFALFGGWGRNNDGYGNNGSSNGGGNATMIYPYPVAGGFGGYGGGASAYYTDAAIQRGFDNQAVINKLNGLENGVCSLGYDQLAQMNNLGTNIMQTGFNTITAINNASVASMQNANALSTQIAQCCCDNREAIAQVRYDNSMNTCNIENAISNGVRDIIQNDNCNYRQIHDELVAIQMATKDDTIAALTNRNAELNSIINSQNTANYIVDQIKPRVVPSFNVPNPNGCGCYNNFSGNLA